MGFQNIGPNYWKGEDGRKALISGKAKFTDKPYVDTWSELAAWGQYMGDGYQAQKYPDSQNLFSLGKAAIYAAGSWDITTFEKQSDFEFGAFPPPVVKAGDTCYISDHTDIAIGLNAKSKNAEAAKTFLSWVASPEFACLPERPPRLLRLNAKVELRTRSRRLAAGGFPCRPSATLPVSARPTSKRAPTRQG
jgi:raffinose/stachyose/melibiose transport system substrate-binding protein